MTFLLFDDLPLQRRCRDCRVPKDLSEFYDHPSITGKDSRCRECAKKYARERRKDPTQSASIRAQESARRRVEPYREKKRAYIKEKLKEVDFKLARSIRGMVRRFILATGLPKTEQSYKMVGYTPEKLRQRIECQFKPGMDWNNRELWHIDHKKPVAAFISQGIRDPRLINALCNLQPLWGSENILKGSKWNGVPANDNTPKGKAA